jgi:DNA-binding NtrC family response regulator
MLHAAVLLVSAEEAVRDSVRAVVHAIKGCCLETTADIAEALRRCQGGDISLLLVSLPGPADLEPVAELVQQSARWPVPLPTIVLAHEDDPELRLKLLAQGAVDCLVMPFELRRLAFLIDILTVRPRYEIKPAVRRQAEAAPENGRHVDGFLFDCPLMRKLLGQLYAVAPLDATILVLGETGVGKTHLARVVHTLSPRKAKPFLVVHCASLPPALLESELFGHVRGAFTHAERDRTGKLAEVQDGTLLLDEADCVPYEAQVKLLRAVEDRVFEPVGSNEPQTLRARLIAASNRPLEEEVAAGRFRADLYYRLNVVSFCLPPLRQCAELIRPLAEKFLAEACARNKRDIGGFSQETLRALQAYHWPGNVRELRNVIDRAAALGTAEVIGLTDLPDGLLHSHRRPDPAIKTAELPCANHLAEARMAAEFERLQEALLRHHNNRTSAAAALGISRVTLYKKLRRYGLI